MCALKENEGGSPFSWPAEAGYPIGGPDGPKYVVMEGGGGGRVELLTCVLPQSTTITLMKSLSMTLPAFASCAFFLVSNVLDEMQAHCLVERLRCWLYPSWPFGKLFGRGRTVSVAEG